MSWAVGRYIRRTGWTLDSASAVTSFIELADKTSVVVVVVVVVVD